jgi:hypothetical protein
MKRFNKVSEDRFTVTVNVLKADSDEVDYTTTMSKEEYTLRLSLNAIREIVEVRTSVDWDVLWGQIEDYGGIKYEEGMDSM